MIQKEFLEVMTKEKLNTEFTCDIEMMNYYANLVSPLGWYLSIKWN